MKKGFFHLIGLLISFFLVSCAGTKSVGTSDIEKGVAIEETAADNSKMTYVAQR